VIPFFCLNGCQEKKEPILPTTVVQSKTAQNVEQTSTAETKAAEPVVQEKKTAEPNTQKQTTAQTQPAAEKNPITPTVQGKIKLTPSSETVKEILLENDFWKTTADDLENSMASDFNWIDINGNKHRLSQYRGKHVLVFEWVTWCPGCESQIPFLVDLRNAVSEDQLIILAPAVKTEKDDLQKVKDYIQKYNINFPVFYQEQRSYGVPYIVNVFVPCLYFIRPEGTLKISLEEILTVRDLVRMLEAK